MDLNLQAKNNLVKRTVERQLKWTRDKYTGEYRSQTGQFSIFPYKNDFVLQDNVKGHRLRGSLKYCKALAEAWLRNQQLEAKCVREATQAVCS